eukprot:5014792-Pyramimonas_sp.AAC.1
MPAELERARRGAHHGPQLLQAACGIKPKVPWLETGRKRSEQKTCVARIPRGRRSEAQPSAPEVHKAGIIEIGVQGGHTV